MKGQWQNSRGVIERIFITGQLTLLTPAHFGNGDSDALTDIPLLLDEVEPNRPLLSGASIAGALRNYLREYEVGYGTAESQDGSLLAEQLFGHLVNDETKKASVESWLFVDDALGTSPSQMPFEIRDGVAINPVTRTADINDQKRGMKFDIELLSAGTTFELRFELWLPKDQPQLLEALAIALMGFEQGKIGLGMRKRRGYGECKVDGWRVQRYSMTTKAGLLGWLNHSADNKSQVQKIADALGIQSLKSARTQAFNIEATFRLCTSLFIRSETGGGDAPDLVHLHSLRAGRQVPILSGTSLAGMVRSQSARIAKTLGVSDDLVTGMFGRRIQPSTDEPPSGSRVIVRETVLEEADFITDRIQNRVKIDRFTGGSYPQALFNQQPVWASPQRANRVRISIELHRSPQANHFEAEVGLLLLVLKDLWTGDLPLGGERSVGRGVLQGEQARLELNDKTWLLSQPDQDGALILNGTGTREELEAYITQLVEVAR